jgi:hypothetical protein
MRSMYVLDYAKIMRWGFIAALFIVSVALNATWWLRLGSMDNHVSDILAPKVRDVVISAMCLVLVLSVVMILRAFKVVRKVCDMPFARTIIKLHTTLATLFVTLAWYDTIKNINTLNIAYKDKGFQSMVDGKLQTAALVFTVFLCKYVCCIIVSYPQKGAAPACRV